MSASPPSRAARSAPTDRRRAPGNGWLAIARAAVGLVIAALALAGCGAFAATPAPGSATGGAVSSPASAGPDRGAAGARAQIAAALSAQQLILADATVPYRPGEPAELAPVPRSVYQVQLRDDPSSGFIVVYDLPSPELAASAGSSLSAWLSSGPGRVQAPLGTVHVLRQLGAALIYYRWLPAAIVDPGTPRIQTALETIGTGIDVPR